MPSGGDLTWQARRLRGLVHRELHAVGHMGLHREQLAREQRHPHDALLVASRQLDILRVGVRNSDKTTSRKRPWFEVYKNATQKHQTKKTKTKTMIKNGGKRRFYQKNKKSNNPVGPYFKFYAKCGVGYSDFYQKM